MGVCQFPDPTVSPVVGLYLPFQQPAGETPPPRKIEMEFNETGQTAVIRLRTWRQMY